MRSVALLLCAQSLLSLGQGPDLIGYWHNWQDANAPYIPLDQVDARYTVIEVSFAIPLPGTTYDMQFAPDQTDMATLQAQVGALQAQGRKVLLSVGGATAAIQLNSDGERDQFVSSLMAIIGTYGFDGIDLDLEGNSAIVTGGTITDPIDGPIIRMIEAVQQLMTQYRAAFDRKMWLTMAPETYAVQGGQSAFSGGWGGQLPIVDALRDSLDILQVQYYNSGTMYGIDGGIYAQGTADFIIAETEAVCHGFQTGGGWFAPLPPEKVAIGLPACPGASQGYVAPVEVAAAVRYLRGEGPQPGVYSLVGQYPGLRGLMTWSINWDGNSACGTPGEFAGSYEALFQSGVGQNEHVGAAMTVAPDPVRAGESVRISIAGASGAIQVCDATGRPVALLPAGGAGLRTWDVPAELVPGLYLLRGITRDGRVCCTRLLVQAD